MTTYKPRVLVLGDYMRDVYWCGSATRLSPEAPIPVVKLDAIEGVFECEGGAGNVANNLEALGCEVVRYENWHKPTKNRLMVGDTQIARWDDDSCSVLDVEDLPGSAGLDAVVVADYKKGSITKEIRDAIEEEYWHLNLFVDTKGNPVEYMSTRYKGGKNDDCVFFPNQAEYNQWESEYEDMRCVVLKRGARGMSLMEFGEIKSYQLATRVSVRSVNGAGDSAMAGFVVSFLKYQHEAPQEDVWELRKLALRYANKCAGIACSKPYTAVVGSEEMEPANVAV